jgi:hypothetical protein
MIFQGVISKSKKVSSLFTPSNNLSYTSQSNLLIENLEFTDKATPVVNITTCTNTTVRNLKFKRPIRDFGTGSYTGKNTTLRFLNCTGIVIENIYLSDVTGGIYLQGCTNITINNIFVEGVQRDPNWGGAGNTGRGQAIQLNDGAGAGGITNIFVYNLPGYTNEDMVNFYNCNFSSEYIIENCQFRGTNDFSSSGGGILAGDGNSICNNITIRNSKLVNVGQYGIAIAGGENNKITNCEVYGETQPNANVGIYVAHYSGVSTCDFNTVTNNTSYYRNAAGTKNNLFSDTVAPNNCTNTTNSGNVDGEGILTIDLVPITIAKETEFEKIVYDSLIA